MMAHPLNSIDYLLKNWRKVGDHSPFYAFFLFTDENKDFQSLFQDKFVIWDRLSGEGCMFFAIAPPPKEWLGVARDRDYWRHYMANATQNKGYDRDAVIQAARFFDVPNDYFPAIVLFRDLDHYDWLTLHLVGLQSAEMDNYIHNLFLLLNHPRVQRYVRLRQLQSLTDYLPINQQHDPKWINKYVEQLWPRQHRQTPNYHVNGIRLRPHRLVYHVNGPQRVQDTLSGLQEELRRLSDQVANLSREQREEFREVRVRLERIEVVLRESATRIENFRRPFIVRWAEAAETASDATRATLHEEFDDFLRQESRHLAEHISGPSSPQLPEPLRIMEDLLEPESEDVLCAAELLWQYLCHSSSPTPLDYSVCGLGFWKALEIELNRVFVDALRVKNNLCRAGVPSVRQTVIPIAKMMENGRFKDKASGNPVVRDVRINLYEEADPNKLRGIELGGVGGLLAASDVNSFQNVLRGIDLPTSPHDSTEHEFLTNLSQQINHVRLVYRNGHAHMQTMPRQTYEEFRTYMLDQSLPHAPMFKTLACKAVFLEQGLI
jgi:hypothetical protein